jgi:hypothetical protein
MQQSPTTQSDVLYTRITHPRFAPNLKLYNGDGFPIVSEVPDREVPSVREESPRSKVNRSRHRKGSRAALLGEGWFKPVTDISTQNNFTVHQSTNTLLEQAAAMTDAVYFGIDARDVTYITYKRATQIRSISWVYTMEKRYYPVF